MTFSRILRATTLAAALLAATGAFAKVYSFKAGGTALPITVPDSWSVSPVKNGIEIRRPDDEVMMWIQAATDASVGPLMDEYKRYFAQQGVSFIGEPKSQEHQLGAASVLDMELPATWKGKPTVVRIAVVTRRDARALLVGYWASPQGDKQSDPDVNAILGSLVAP